MSPRREIGVALLVAAAVRGPFLFEALRTPVDGDTAIIGLMARHPLSSWTMWGQPYGSPLEGLLAAPLVALLGGTPAPLRLLYLLLGLALVPLVHRVAGRLDQRAAFPAAMLMACPSAYMILTSVMPAPLYPGVLLLCGVLAARGLGLVERLRAGERPLVALATWGALAGLALWSHPASVSTVAACGLGLAIASGWNPVVAAVTALPLIAAAAPWWLQLAFAPQAASLVAASGHRATTSEHLLKVLPRLDAPIRGLLGAHVPVIPDDNSHVVHAPAWIAFLLLTLVALLLLDALRGARTTSTAAVLGGCVVLAVLVFPLPARSNPSSIRYLTPLYLPLVALLAWSAVRRLGPRRARIVVLALMALDLGAASRLLAAWRATPRSQPPFLLEELGPLQAVLAAHGVHHAYASYVPAYRLSYESDEAIVASEPWNERFRNLPLPRIDEVRFAKDVAWVLAPTLPSDLPQPPVFEAALRAIGGNWRRTDVGGFVVYDGFAPPFSPRVTPLTPARSAQGVAVASLPASQPVAVVTILAAGPGALPRNMDVETSPDGTAFELVGRRRRIREREDLSWVNGHPQYLTDGRLMAIPLGGARPVAAVRITDRDGGDPVVQVLLHGSEAATAPWDEWLAPRLGWPARKRELAARPEPEREDWYYRSLVAAAH